MLYYIFQPEDSNGQLDYRYDEFGFKVEEEGLFILQLSLSLIHWHVILTLILLEASDKSLPPV